MSLMRLGCGSCGAERERGMGLLAAVCAAVDETGNCTSYLPEYTGVAVPAVATPSAGNWLENLISGVAKTGENILTQQNLARGVYTSTGPGGQTTTYVQPAGTSQNVFAATQTGVAGNVAASGIPNLGMIVIGGAALLLVFMLARKK
jgi:hypothetical protein